MANEEFIGRRESVGLGIEATAGTAVAPQVWVRQLSSTFAPKATKLTNESAMGRVEKTNDSVTDQIWSEGTLEGKVADISVGYLLTGLFGLPVTTDNADTNAAVKDHTFDVAQTNVPTYLTVAVKNPVVDRRYALGVVGDLEITSETGDWVKFSANMKAKAAGAASNTVAYVDETEFSAKDASVKLATNVAGLSGAAALDVTRFSITIERKSEPHFPLGSTAPTAMNTGVFEATAEFVLRYTSTAHEDDWYSNAIKALEFKLANTGVTIGAAANPSLTFTAPKARLSTFEKSDDLDEIVTQTVGVSFELSTSDAYALRAVLTNTQASYVA